MNKKEKKTRTLLIGLCSFLCVLPLLMWLIYFSDDLIESNNSKLKITVTITPQKTFVERITGTLAKVSVLVPKNYNPETYIATPRQIEDLSKSNIYFSQGMPCEEILIPKIKILFKKLEVVDTHEGFSFRIMHEPHFHDGGEHNHSHHHHGTTDPHTWLNPILVKQQASIIAKKLSQANPENSKLYIDNLEAFHNELDQVNQEIKTLLNPYKGKSIIVHHPAFGYFTDAYGLTQVSLELGGKEPSPKHIENLIQFAKENDIHVIFVQPQFNDKSANIIAEAINGSVVAIDPLDENYIDNLKRIALAIKNGFTQ